MRWTVCAFLLACVGCMQSAPPGPNPGAKSPPGNNVSLSVVEWPELEKAIARHKGKVVVVDVWADFCVPCKKKFPAMLELHKKYAAQGVVLISVNLDDTSDAKKALAFLQRVDARIPNYLLDAKPDLIDAKLGGTAIPIVRVYGRDGSLAKLFTPDNDFDVPDVEAAVVAALK
jgi:thiol-disulfide isomerase/thioredoxin